VKCWASVYLGGTELLVSACRAAGCSFLHLIGESGVLTLDGGPRALLLSGTVGVLGLHVV
jgi:hypothetical protein